MKVKQRKDYRLLPVNAYLGSVQVLIPRESGTRDGYCNNPNLKTYRGNAEDFLN